MYPWQKAQWRKLASALNNQSLAHAYLLDGPKGVGKEDFAIAYAKYLLCLQRDDVQQAACGECSSCHLFEAGTHPDLKVISPEGASHSIVVDQIRGLIDYLSLTPHKSSRKIAIIHAADRMNTAAANSLLKSLEEPPSSAMMLLSSCFAQRLLPTIRSRCQSLHFPLPDVEITRPWLAVRLAQQQQAELLLAIANGAPLEAAALADGDVLDYRQSVIDDLSSVSAGELDPIKVAAKWNKGNVQDALFWVWSFVSDMTRLKVAEFPPVVNNPDYADQIRVLIQPIPLPLLLMFLQRVEQANRHLAGNMNKQLLLEELLLQWSAVLTTSPQEVIAQ